MALNFTVSYTFSPNTVISSSQVNTNTNDVANVFTGLEALTKSFAKLKVDVDPTTSLEVATKQYVDHYGVWRRPNLQFASVTTVAVEAGLDGTSGDIPILFPDGSVRTETSTTRTTFNITRNAVLTTASAQSGLRSSLSEATNTWYALYAVKVTDSSTQWCTVGDTLIPTQANFSSLNSNFGSNGWVYLGMVRNGDNSGATGDLLVFSQIGNFVQFLNTTTGSAFKGRGIRMATTAGAVSLTYAIVTGTGTAQIPSHCAANCLFQSAINPAGAGNGQVFDSSASGFYIVNNATGGIGWTSSYFYGLESAGAGTLFQRMHDASSVAQDIYLMGFYDGVLGIGSNPIL